MIFNSEIKTIKNKMIALKVGKRMKMIRTMSDLQQKVLATKLGIQPSLLSLYEQGKREPSLTTLKTFCDYFKISLTEFFSLVEGDLSNTGDTENNAINSKILSTLKEIEKFYINSSTRTNS